MTVFTLSVFSVGVLIGLVCGLLLAMWWLLQRDDDLKSWRYACTCGWSCVYLSTPTIAPSFVRCDQCKGVAIRRRDPEQVPA